MTTLTINIREEDKNFIQSALKEGRYSTESEAVSEALSELRIREEVRHSRINELREKVMIGLEQLDRGEGIEWNAEEIKTKGRALLKK